MIIIISISISKYSVKTVLDFGNFSKNAPSTFKKIGRNHLVTIKKGDAVKVLKYKKAQKFLNDGWTL